MEELVVVEDSVGEELMVKESVVGGDSAEAIGGSVLESSVAGSETGGIAHIAMILPFSKLTRRPYLVSRWSLCWGRGA